MAGLDENEKDDLRTQSEEEAPDTPTIPATRRRSPLASLLTGLIFLVALVAALAYAATAFRDKDERLAAIADYVDEGVAQVRALISPADDGRPTAIGKLTTPRLTPAPESSALEPSTPEPSTPESSAAEPPGEATGEAQRLPPPAAEAQPLPAPAPQGSPQGSPQIAARAEPVVDADTLARTLERLAAAEETARKALVVAEEARAAAKAAAAGAAPPAADHLSSADMMSALEGRVDQLTEQIISLRAQLESPKTEGRAAPEQSVAKTEAAGTGDAAVARVVLAYALQRELEAGRPYSDETAALERLGVEPNALAAVAPFAERGAPTAAALRQSFAPIAKRLRALESAQGGLAEHLIQGAGKLVRVRPTGQGDSEAASVDDRIGKVEAALAANDLAGAGRALEALPDAAKAETKDFADALHRREEAARAANELLHGAIVALGGVRK